MQRTLTIYELDCDKGYFLYGKEQLEAAGITDVEDIRRCFGSQGRFLELTFQRPTHRIERAIETAATVPGNRPGEVTLDTTRLPALRIQHLVASWHQTILRDGQPDLMETPKIDENFLQEEWPQLVEVLDLFCRYLLRASGTSHPDFTKALQNKSNPSAVASESP